MNEQYRNLVLMRHAKSAYPDGIADHDRPLAPRGIREAGLAGGWLRANLPAVDAVLCSTATRARQTLAHTGIDAPARYAERLYGAAPGTVIEEINRVGDNVTTLLVVGHEPTTSALAIVLASISGTDAAVAERISEKFPDVGDRRATRRRTLGRRRTGVCRAGRLSRATVEVLLLRKPSAAYFLLKAAEPASARVCTPTRR